MYSKIQKGAMTYYRRFNKNGPHSDCIGGNFFECIYSR